MTSKNVSTIGSKLDARSLSNQSVNKGNKFQLAKNILEPVIVRFEEFVVGHELLAERILTALLAESHVVLEGVPGTAKTLSVKVMSRLLGIDFARIQLTPDLLPGDITGGEVYRRDDFETRWGPIFANLVLVDEINRASPKTQSALLEAMEERQVTIGDETKLLPKPFMVQATMNPLEQEGTYPLPEAQLDRFLFKLVVKNVRGRELLSRIYHAPDIAEAEAMLSGDQILQLQALVKTVVTSKEVEDYCTDLTEASLSHSLVERVGQEDDADSAGASNRRSKLLYGASKARALIHGRSYVTADDMRDLVPDALRHVLVLTDQAYIENVTVETVIQQIIDSVPMPEDK